MRIQFLAIYLLGGLMTFLISLRSQAVAVDFNEQIQPIFVGRCDKCHGPEKALAKLRLHNAEAIRALEKPELLVAGDPAGSTLFQRITLPEDDKKRMPKEGDPLTEEQIELIRLWIAEGASLDDHPSETDEAPAAAEAVDELDNLRPASQEAIDAIVASGGNVSGLSEGSPLLQVRYAFRNPAVDDEALASLTGAASQIAWLDVSEGQITQTGMHSIGKLENLSRLHLEKSSVVDDGLAELAGLRRLEYLNLYGTNVTDAGLQHLKGLKRLRRLYLWQTNVSYAAAQELEQAIPGLKTNLGWNHPEVVRARLADQVERLRTELEESTAQVTELEQQVNAARDKTAQLENRLKEAQKQLQALDSPNDGESGDAP